jgi:hypothetical protein
VPEKRESNEEPLDPNAWMNTFCDLLLLMLTFFVLLLTMSSLDAQKLAEVARPGTLIHDTGGASQHKEIMILSQELMISPDISPPRHANYMARVPANIQELGDAQEKLVTNLGLEGDGWLERTPRKLSVHLDATRMFEPGSLILTPFAKGYIVETAQVFARHKRAILRVEVWRDGGESLLEREAALELALLRCDVLVKAFSSQNVAERSLQIGAYEGSAGVREERFLRQPELVSFVMAFEPDVLR